MVESELPTAAVAADGDAQPDGAAEAAVRAPGRRRGVVITPEQVRAVLDLYDQGRMLRAYAVARSYGPLGDWRGPAGRVLAGRLAQNLGAPQLARVLHRLAFRESPDDPEAIYYHARALLERHGVLRAWEFMNAPRGGAFDRAADDLRADWFAMHALVMGAVRDFEAAEKWLARAEEAAPRRPWLWIERSAILERQDRYADALASARRAFELRPWYRPAVQAVSHLLQLLDRDGEALAFLTDAAGRLESGPVVGHLAALQYELGQYEASRQSWERLVELSPLADEDFGRWLAARRADAAYYCGDLEAAVRLGRESKSPFHQAVADRIEQSKGEGKRVLLSVPFVRQHHRTCGPATLSALSRFWSMPADHLEVVERICYDGTPAESERRWAEQNGFAAVEFTVTWDAAVALIDRGVPFTLTTVEPTSAHLQACVGYDAVRGTLLIRDPYERVSGEFNAGPFFERYRSTGPRGMAMVPRDRAGELLGNLDLPDVRAYDLANAVQRALLDHRRDGAGRAYADLVTAVGPEHRLTLHVRRSLAAYDGDAADGLAALEAMLGLFPDDRGLLLARLGYLRTLGRRDERLALLQRVSGEKEIHPVFWSQLAQELRDDAREHPAAIRLLRRAIRYAREDAGNYWLLASVLWHGRRFEEALPLYRFATTLDDKNETFSRSYFIACRHFKQADQAVRLLRDRFERFGRKSADPAVTLFGAYEMLGRMGDAFALLDEALDLRPDDADLLLLAADAHARHGQFDQAESSLESARDRSRPGAWRRGAAEVARFRGDPARARQLWREVLEDEPLALDAHRNLARLLAESEGKAAALSHLEEACRRFPQSYPLHQLWIEHLRDESPEAAEPVIRRLIDIHPADAWVRRELIGSLSRQKRFDEALAEAALTQRLDPTNPSTHYFHGKVLADTGRREEARAAYRQAVSLSVDAEFAMSELVHTCDTLAQRREALGFVREELKRQTIFGEALLAYRNVASGVLDPQEVLAGLREALDARPDLWHAWAAVVGQLTDMDRLDGALERGNEAVERFPLLPQLWTALATAHRMHGHASAEVVALEKALQISPGWSAAVRQLCEAYERAGRFDESRELLERAAARDPLDAYNHGCLADAEWRAGRRPEAVERVKRSLQLEPGYQWAWDALRRWTAELGQPQAGVEVARELMRTRGGEARSWLVLARMLGRPEELEGRLAALGRAIEANPRSFEAHDMRARSLGEAGRLDEAESACRPAVYGGRAADLPLPLRGRLAWILERRGDRAGAIARMRELVAEEPGYYWGWAQLCEWCEQAGDKDGWLEAAIGRARGWPHDPVALSSLGDARLAKGERDAARAAYRRALEVSPEHAYAGFNLFDLQLQDKLTAEAEATLGLLRTHAPGPHTKEREVELAAQLADHDGAVRGVAALAVTPMQGDLWPLKAAIDAANRAGWAADVEQVLTVAAARPEVHPYVGDYLVRRLAGRVRRPSDRQCRALVERLEGFGAAIGEEALAAWVRLLAEWAAREPDKPLSQAPIGELPLRLRRVRSAPLRRLIRRRRDQLRGRPVLYGVIGYALQTIRDYRGVIDWMSDWRDRAGVEGWMLVNLSEAYRALGRDAEGRAVNEHASRLAAAPSARTAIHCLWLAADAACAGDVATARTLLGGIDAGSLGASYQFLLGTVEAVLLVLAAPKPRDGLPAAKARLATAIKAFPKFRRDSELRRAYRASVRRMARADIGLIGRWWCWWQLAAPGR